MAYCYRNYIKVMIENWLVRRSTGNFPPRVSRGSAVLFRIQEPLYSYKLLKKIFWFLYILQTPAFWFSQIPGIFTNSPTRFFSRLASEGEMGRFSMITNYYHWYNHQLFLLHYHCFWIIITVYSKVWGTLVYSCSEHFQYWVRFYGDHAIDLCRKLVGWFLVYTGSTWYISDE